jgi:hypothetical protein
MLNTDERVKITVLIQTATCNGCHRRVGSRELPPTLHLELNRQIDPYPEFDSAGSYRIIGDVPAEAFCAQLRADGWRFVGDFRAAGELLYCPGCAAKLQDAVAKWGRLTEGSQSVGTEPTGSEADCSSTEK